MKRFLYWSLLAVALTGGGCGTEKLGADDPGPDPDPHPRRVESLAPIATYPGLILRADSYNTYKSRFGQLPDDSPAKRNKIVRALFSDSAADKQSATQEFIRYWKEYAQRWTQQALDQPEPDGVAMRGIWRTIHLYDIVKSFGYLRPGEESEFRTAVFQAVKWAIGNDSKHPRIPQGSWRMSNIYTDVFCAAGLVGLTFWDQPQSVDWVNHAISELEWQLKNCVWDGCWHETPRYHAYTMKLMGQFMEVLCNRTGIDLFHLEPNKQLARWFVDFNTPLDRVAGANAGVATGVRMFPGLGDAAWGENLAPLNLYASHYRTSDPGLYAELMWLWQQTGYRASEEPVLDLLIDPLPSGSKPTARGSVASPRRGYLLMRSGFETPDEVWLLLKCGETSMHDHGDKNSFSLIAYGTPLALDAGTGDYDDPLHRTWNKREISHNGVVLRNKGETDIFNYSVQKALSGRIIHWQSGERLDYSVTDAAAPMAATEYTREIVFVKPDYFVLRDQIKAATNKEAVWMLQTPCEQIEWNAHSILCSNAWGTALEVHVAAPATTLTPIQSKGKFGTWTDAKPDANVGLYPFKYQTTLQVIAPPIDQIVTVLHPMRANGERLSVTSSDNGSQLDIRCGGRNDRIRFTTSGVEAVIGGEEFILNK